MKSFEEKSPGAASGDYQGLLLQKYAPPCLLVDQKEKILLISGAIEKYLSVANKMSVQLLSEFVDKSIYQELSKGIREVVQGEESVLIDSRAFNVSVPFHMYITPFVAKQTNESLILIEFEGINEQNEKNASLTAFELLQQFEAFSRTTEHDIRNLTNNYIMLLKLEETRYSTDNKMHDVKVMQARLLSAFKKNIDQLRAMLDLPSSDE